jgi:hypothetical protein
LQGYHSRTHRGKPEPLNTRPSSEVPRKDLTKEIS